MKKIFIALAAVAALAACTKSEVKYDEPSAISFAPVAQNITKSVAGYTYGTPNTIDGALPNDIDLYVFANTQGESAEGTLTSNWPNQYFKNTPFIYNRIQDNGVYEGSTPQYWPNVKSLIFAGYTEAGNMATLATGANPPTMDFDNNTLNINGYVQNNSGASEGTNDLMWFPWDGKSYKKQTNAVAVNLQHACSWITVKVIGDSYTGDNYKVTDLTINGLYHTGNATCKATTTGTGDEAVTTYNAEWTTTDAASPENLYSNATGETFPKNTTSGASPKVFENVSQNMIVIPQTPTTIDVSYSYVPQEGLAAITETVKGLSLKFDGETKWQSGVHYIYTITITATEILIDPTVAEWVSSVVTPGVSI